MARQGTRLLAALASLALGAGFVACGGDDEDADEAATGPQDITVTADEYSFALSEEPQAGEATFSLVNEGEEFHVLLIARINEGFTVDEALEAQGRKGTAEEVGGIEAGPGEEAEKTIEADLTSGQYVLLCPVESKGKPHYELGQLEELTIE